MAPHVSSHGHTHQVRTMRGHTGRVSSLASPKPRPWMVSSGGRDSSIINHDLRAPNHVASTLLAHTQEVRPARRKHTVVIYVVAIPRVG